MVPEQEDEMEAHQRIRAVYQAEEIRRQVQQSGT